MADIVRLLYAFAACFLMALPAAAQDEDAALPTPFQLYMQGDFEGAIAEAERRGDAASLAVAARAAMADANIRDAPCMECLKRAESYARRALEKEKRADAYVFLVAALGHQARLLGVVRARLANLPGLMKQALDAALALSPNDPWALAAMGAWHFGVVKNGGRFLAKMIYGASIEDGMDYFRRSFISDSTNPVLYFQYILALTAHDLDSYRKEIAGTLAAAAEMPPRTAYDKTVKARISHLRELLPQENDVTFLAQVRRYQGYFD